MILAFLFGLQLIHQLFELFPWLLFPFPSSFLYSYAAFLILCSSSKSYLKLPTLYPLVDLNASLVVLITASDKWRPRRNKDKFFFGWSLLFDRLDLRKNLKELRCWLLVALTVDYQHKKFPLALLLETKLSSMVEIDTWKHQIFEMPTECAEFHANIHPRSIDAGHWFLVWKLQKRIFVLLKTLSISFSDIVMPLILQFLLNILQRYNMHEPEKV